MSDNTEDLKVDRQGDCNYDSICRDFIRGVCARKYCKYKHEFDICPLNFCHDFQNGTCPRPNCKFIHCSTDEEDLYKNTGEMSNLIIAEGSRKSQLPGFHPICSQFQKGLCRRPTCKYRHISKEDSETEIAELLQNNPTNKQNIEMSKFLMNNIGSPSNVLITGIPRWNGIFLKDDFGLPAAKRRFIASDDIEYTLENDCNIRQPLFKGYFAGNPPLLSGVDRRTIMLEEENNLLHKEIAQLKKRVSDLMATNEFLLDQNANLRISNQHNASVPAVTITNTLPQNNTPPQVIRTVTANVTTVPGVPVSIATVSAGNSVSASHVSIAGCPAVSIAPTAQILAPSQQILVTANPPSQLTIANSSQGPLAISAQSAQQLTLASTTPTNQHLVLSSASAPQAQPTQQLALVDSAQAQQLGLTNAPQQLTVASVPQQLLAASNQQLELHRNNQLSAISTSQGIALSNATQPLVSFPIMTQTMTHALPH